MIMTKISTSQAEFSWSDKKRGIKIPQLLSQDMAALDGIIRSDGSVVYGQDHHNDVIIFGHSQDDLPFLSFYVPSLIQKVHGKVPIKIHKYPSAGKCLRVEVHSKAIASFWNKVMKIPTNKRDFELYHLIIKNKKLMILNLQSYFDGDGSICFSSGTRRYSRSKTKINYYPLMDWHTESSKVAEQIKQILIQLKFNPFECKHIEEKGGRTRHTVRVGGRYSYERFLNIFNLNNPKHLTKILIYEIYGFCPPNTTLGDRLKILQGGLTPESFYDDKVYKIRPIIMKENEEKVLKVLLKGPTYYKQIMRETNLNTLSVIRRLEKFKQIRCLGMKKLSGRRSGKFYGITDAGKKRINRAAEIKEKLRNQFNLKL